MGHWRPVPECFRHEEKQQDGAEADYDGDDPKDNQRHGSWNLSAKHTRIPIPSSSLV